MEVLAADASGAVVAGVAGAAAPSSRTGCSKRELRYPAGLSQFARVVRTNEAISASTRKPLNRRAGRGRLQKQRRHEVIERGKVIHRRMHASARQG